MEMHAIIDADREESLVIQFSNAFINSLFDLRRIMHFYHNLHVLCINVHQQLVCKLRVIAENMRDIFFSDMVDRELRCCMLLMEFMLTLDEHRDEFVKELSTESRTSYSDDVMRRMIMVTDYIKNNLTADDLSQASMARMAGVSKDYFSRIFKIIALGDHFEDLDEDGIAEKLKDEGTYEIFKDFAIGKMDCSLCYLYSYFCHLFRVF